APRTPASPTACRATTSPPSSCPRLVGNPEHTVEQTTGPFSIRHGIFIGWTLPELAILHRYRKRELMRPNLAVLRSAMAPMLTETGAVKRATGDYTFDEETGLEDREYVTVYEGPVLVQPEGDVTLVNVGGGTWPIRPLDVAFPADADVAIGDVLTLTDCPGVPGLVGREIGITDVKRDAWQVARFCTGRLAGSA
ncbi:MAG: DUF6093 family protein, partial [Nocardioides sp.]